MLSHEYDHTRQNHRNWNSTRKSSFSSLKPIVERARHNRRAENQNQHWVLIVHINYFLWYISFTNRKATKWGTKFSSPSTLDRSLKTGWVHNWHISLKVQQKLFVLPRYSKKQLGMAAGAGFIGGSAFGHGSSLASYSVYHRCLEIADICPCSFLQLNN